MGFNDAADLRSMADWGDTPGTLGINDGGDPSLVEHYFRGVGPLHLVTEADEEEYRLFTRKITVHGKEKSFPIITDKDVYDYVRHRNEFFRSAAAYGAFAEESDQELKENLGLRKLIELRGDAQTVFYRWVRKAYRKKLGEDANVPQLIRASMSPALIQALAKVKVSYQKRFKAGGFNPRPMKLGGKYRLGTLSDHALGRAADINDQDNPQLTIPQWQFILKFVGKAGVDRSALRWKSNPEALWQDIKTVNDLFVEKIDKETKRIEKERVTTVPGTLGKTMHHTVPPLDIVLAGMPELKKWSDGFFRLEWPLVKELHANGLLWGATFSTNVDLHHFQL